MRVSFYTMAVAALGATEVLTAELKNQSDYENLNLNDNELDLAEVDTDGEFIGGLMGGIGNIFGGRRGHNQHQNAEAEKAKKMAMKAAMEKETRRKIAKEKKAKKQAVAKAKRQLESKYMRAGYPIPGKTAPLINPNGRPTEIQNYLREMAHHDMQQKLLMEKNHREMMTNAMERQRMMMNESRRPGMPNGNGGGGPSEQHINQATNGGLHEGMNGHALGYGANTGTGGMNNYMGGP